MTKLEMSQAMPMWRIPGVVTEKRPLKTKADKIWAYMMKVMAYGGTYEITTKNPEQYDAIVEGEQIVMVGDFDQYKGELKLTLKYVEDSTAGKITKQAS